jgi:hypothetical protein
MVEVLVIFENSVSVGVKFIVTGTQEKLTKWSILYLSNYIGISIDVFKNNIFSHIVLDNYSKIRSYFLN